MSQLKQEISLICDLPLNEIQHTDVEQHLIQILEKSHSDVLAVRLIYKFRNSFSKKTKDTLCGLILNLLYHPDMCDQSPKAFDGPDVILTDLIIDSLHSEHHIVLDFLHYIEGLYDRKYGEIYISIIQELSRRCSNTSFFSDCMMLVYPLLNLVELKTVPDLLARPDMWVVDKKTSNSLLDFMKREVDQTHNIEQRCFLYGFLELFVYDETNPPSLDIFTKPEMENKVKLMELKYSIDNKINDFHATMYGFLLKLFTKNKKIKVLFQEFLLAVILKNQERTKMNPDHSLVDLDGVMLNLSGILSKFCAKIMNNNLFDLINPAFLYNFGEEVINPNIKILKNEKAVNSFTSCIFFCKLKFINLGVLQLLTQLRVQNNRIYYIEQEIKLSSTPPDRKEELEKRVKFFKGLTNAYRLVLRSCYYEGDLKFFDFVGSYLIESYGKILPDFRFKKLSPELLSDLSLNSDKNSRSKQVDQNKRSEQVICSVKTFPDYIYDILFTTQLSFEKLSKSFMPLAAEVLKADLPNFTFKSSLVKAFCNCHNIVLTPEVFNGLLKYYVELDKLDDFGFDRTVARSSIIDSLNSDGARRIMALNTKKPIHLKFLHSFLNDIKQNLSNGLLAIQEIVDFRRNKDKYSGELLEEKERKFADNEKTAEYSFEQLNVFLKFLHRLIRTCVYKVFSDRLILGTFVGILNCNLKIIVGPSCSTLKLPNKDNYNFEPRTILFLIVNIYLVMDEKCTIEPEKEEDLKLMDRNEFLENIISDPIYFSMELFIKTFGICRRKSILGESELLKLKRFVNKMANLYKEKTSTPIESNQELEIPDEFIDPLTFTVMENPVKLSTSGKTVDMETYGMLMLGDGLDPFNREPLSLEKISDDLELKQKIMEWHNKYK
ncbi:Ubiquitin conjugation factor E4 [Cucumispora dikerogammari]|nr:Ubiquitin conjugation factor E4 [Cucumispora dikerogammari]